MAHKPSVEERLHIPFEKPVRHLREYLDVLQPALTDRKVDVVGEIWSGTADLLTYYPPPVKDWIRRNGGLTTEMKKIKNGGELWKIVDPCPEEW